MLPQDSLVEEEEEDLILPLKWKPGEDLMGKMLLSHPTVIDLIVHSLVDASIPVGSYAVAQTEWADESIPDMLYAPQAPSTSMPPILIKMQSHVDQEFMFRIIKYSTDIYARYKALPVVLVVATQSFAASFEEKFTISPNGCLLEASSVFWAKQCLVLSASTLSDHLVSETMDPMAALGYFLIRHELFELPEHHRTDATLATLSSIITEILPQGDEDEIRKISTLHQLSQAKRLFQEIVEENEWRWDFSSKRNKKNAEEGILFIEQVKKSLKDMEKEKLDHSITSKYSYEDSQFIENMRKPGRRKDWKSIFSEGKKKGLLRSYKSTVTLRSSYYKLQKRRRQRIAQ